MIWFAFTTIYGNPLVETYRRLYFRVLLCIYIISALILGFRESVVFQIIVCPYISFFQINPNRHSLITTLTKTLMVIKLRQIMNDHEVK
jgi:hypothetical protein